MESEILETFFATESWRISCSFRVYPSFTKYTYFLIHFTLTQELNLFIMEDSFEYSCNYETETIAGQL